MFVKAIAAVVVLMMCLARTACASDLWADAGQLREVRRCGDGVLYETDASHGTLLVARVRGTHKEMGRQYGCLLGDKIISVMQVYTKASDPKDIKKTLIFRACRNVWKRNEPHVPNEYKDEIVGIAQGANKAGFDVSPQLVETGIALPNFSDMHDKKLMMSGLNPDDAKRLGMGAGFDFRTTCSSFAAWGGRTEGGRLFATRDLDWESKTGVGQYGLVTVYEPAGDDGSPRNRYVTFGYPGVIGAIAGMSEKGITIGEIGAVNTVETQEGTPWTITMRRALEEADNLEEAIAIIEKSKNTVGYNFVVGFGDPLRYGTPGFSPAAVAIEQNGEFTSVFRDDDPKERESAWIDADGNPVLKDGEQIKVGLPLKEAVYRADTSFDLRIRGTQTASNGPARENSNGDPRESGAYSKRYAPNFYMLDALAKGEAYSSDGREIFAAGAPRLISAEETLRIMDAVSMKDSNILAVAYDATSLEFWVAYESMSDGNWKPASDNKYSRFRLKDLFSE
ncbi:MAG TPA: C45 family autoproteolytic acyltransferase/hydrolase [bacterium]|nr:C45 family autoproteolytic acyltransferase/hydrolase [bacterium]